MKSRFTLFQSVVANRDLIEPELMGAWGRGRPALIGGSPGVEKGTRGAIVEIFESVGEVAVEFFDDCGETIDVAFIPESYVSTAPEDREGDERSAPDVAPRKMAPP